MYSLKVHITNHPLLVRLMFIIDNNAVSQAKYDKKKEAVLEEMEIEASKLEKDVEDDFGNGKFAVVRGIIKFVSIRADKQYKQI